MIQHKTIIISFSILFFIGLVFLFFVHIKQCVKEIAKIEKWKSEFSYPVWKQGNYYNNITIDSNVYRVFVVRDYDLSQLHTPLHIYFYIPHNDKSHPIKITYGNNYEITTMKGRIPSDKYVEPYPCFFFYTENEIDAIKQEPLKQVDLQAINRLLNRNNAIVLVKLDDVSRDIQEVRIALPTLSFIEDLRENSEKQPIMSVLIEALPSLPFEVIDPLPASRETPILMPYISKTLFWRISHLLTKKSPLDSKGMQVFSFILSNYLLVLGAVFLVFYVSIIITNRYISLKIEPFSVLSFMALVFNYIVLEFLSRFGEGGVGLPAIGRGDSELLSFLGGCFAVFLGHIAMLKIRRNRYKGKKLAVIALVGGYLCVSFWVGLLVVFGIGMSSF